MSVTETEQTWWVEGRQRMLLDPTAINLNTGSFGPLSQPVFDEVTRLRQQLAAEPMDFLLRQAPPLLWSARQRLATFLGTQPERLAFASNVTSAINQVANGLVLSSPGEILLSDHEYGAMHWCWERAARRQGLTLRTFPLPHLPASPGEIVEAFLAAVSPRTQLLFFSHVLSPTGMVLPAAELCREARRRGIVTVIDGAHAPAMIPLNLDALACDYYAGNCHKWLLAPTGSGFLMAAPGQLERLVPDRVSWGWHHEGLADHARDVFGSTALLRALEFEGTRDPCTWIAVSAALDFLEELGLERIHERMAQLASYARVAIRDHVGLSLATPEAAPLRGALTAFRLPDGVNPEALRNALWERYRIEAPIIERPDRLLIRVSTHFYNTTEEIDALAKALPELLHK